MRVLKKINVLFSILCVVCASGVSEAQTTLSWNILRGGIGTKNITITTEEANQLATATAYNSSGSPLDGTLQPSVTKTGTLLTLTILKTGGSAPNLPSSFEVRIRFAGAIKYVLQASVSLDVQPTPPKPVTGVQGPEGPPGPTPKVTQTIIANVPFGGVPFLTFAQSGTAISVTFGLPANATLTSQLTNDVGFLTEVTLPMKFAKKPTYEAMRLMLPVLVPHTVLVESDEKHDPRYASEYRIWPPNIIMWQASIQDSN